MKNKTLAIALLLIIILEGYFIFYYKKGEGEKPVTTKSVVVKKHSLFDLLEDLKNNSYIEVSEIYTSGEGYIIKGTINGSNEEFTEKINLLDKFKISDYSLEIDGVNVSGKFTFKYS